MYMAIMLIGSVIVMVQKYWQLAEAKRIVWNARSNHNESEEAAPTADDLAAYEEYIATDGKSPYPGTPITTCPVKSRTEGYQYVVPNYPHIPPQPGVKRKRGRIPKIKNPPRPSN